MSRALDHALRDAWRRVLEGDDAAPELAAWLLKLDDPVPFLDGMLDDMARRGHQDLLSFLDGVSPEVCLVLLAVKLLRDAETDERRAELRRCIDDQLAGLAEAPERRARDAELLRRFLDRRVRS